MEPPITPCGNCKRELFLLDEEAFDRMQDYIREHAPDVLRVEMLHEETGGRYWAARRSSSMFVCPDCGHGNLLPPRFDFSLN